MIVPFSTEMEREQVTDIVLSERRVGVCVLCVFADNMFGIRAVSLDEGDFSSLRHTAVIGDRKMMLNDGKTFISLDDEGFAIVSRSFLSSRELVKVGLNELARTSPDGNHHTNKSVIFIMKNGVTLTFNIVSSDEICTRLLALETQRGVFKCGEIFANLIDVLELTLKEGEYYDSFYYAIHPCSAGR